MQKKEFKKLDLSLYYEKLENGLEVYVVPKENVNGIYATFSTRYGSKTNEFVPIKEKKMVRVPDGIAHFLEHKMFSQRDGIDPFTFYGDNGAEANASTSAYKTTYEFSGPSNIEENLNYLLDYVQSPYFTDEDVEKEKGIIEQEINMYNDHPYSVLYEKSLYNSFVKNPIRISIAGTVDSINKITKEDLYLCYETFYHPSNMFLVVTGNVNPDSIIETVKENQRKKDFRNPIQTIKIKEYNEPDKVFKEKEIIKMNVNIPKISLNYKFNITDIKLPKRIIIDYLIIYFNLKFGDTSLFIDKLKEEELINESINFTFIDINTHILFIFNFESKKYEEVIERVKKEIMNFDIDESDFERKKKTFISSYIYMSDNLYRMNSKVMGNVIDGEVITNDYDEIKNFDYEEFKKIINNLDFGNNNLVIIKK